MNAGRIVSTTIWFWILLSTVGLAQKENNIWYFGDRAGIDFNTTPPMPLTDGRMSTVEGCASIADPCSGDLLFYTDGVTVWNRRHAVMPNGNGLHGSSSSTQSALILQAPDSNDLYYIFTAAPIEGEAYRAYGIQYSMVDMRLDGGLGDVTIRNVLRTIPGTEKLTAVCHANGDDLWVITHSAGTREFHAYRVTSLGVAISPAVSYVGPTLTETSLDNQGYLQASPNGRRLAMAAAGPAVYNSGHAPLQLYRFDNRTGGVSDPIVLADSGSFYGVCFSPDNSKLYATSFLENGFALSQWDLSSNDPVTMVASRTVIRQIPYEGLGALQLAPNGQIFVAHSTAAHLGMILEPNLQGTACNYVPDGFDLRGRISQFGLPNIAIASPPIVISPDTTICAGESAFLRADKGTTYEWSPADGLSCSNCPDPVATPTTTTTYTVRTTTETGCPISREIIVIVRPSPTVDAGPERTICAGRTTQLHGGGAVSYRWSPPIGLSCNDCPDPIAEPTVTTTYIVTGTNDLGCSSSDSVTVRVAPSVDAGPDRTICIGDSVRLQASQADNYFWSPSTGLSCTDCPDPIARPATTTDYIVTGTNSFGCITSDSITLTVAILPTVDAGPDRTSCSGQPLQLRATGAERFSWSPTTELSCADCPDPIAVPTTTTTYRVIGTNASGCSDTDMVTIAIAAQPTVNAGLDATTCAGRPVQLRATGTARVTWSPAVGLSCTDCPDPTATPPTTTVYIATGSNQSGCFGIDSVTVTVIPAPLVDAGEEHHICLGGTVQLQALVDRTARLSWSPTTGLSCRECPDPIAAPVTTTVYTLTTTDSSGCSAVDSVMVVVVPRPSVNAGRDTTICLGGTALLSASPSADGRSYLWSPPDGLSCPACRSTPADPASTTDYVLTVTDGDVCSSSDTVRVSVVSSLSIAGASIPKSFRLMPGSPALVPIILDDSIDRDAVDLIDFYLTYDPQVLQLEHVDLSGTLLEGWAILNEQNDRVTGNYSARLQAPNDKKVSGTGELLRLKLDGYIGSSDSSELKARLSLPNGGCTAIETSSGTVRIDSICGLALRLIEIGTEGYSLEPNRPNPFNPTTEIPFSIGLDGPARLEVFDANGRSVALLVDGYVKPGKYLVTWDASGYPSGIYYYRLTSGTWSESNPMMLVK